MADGTLGPVTESHCFNRMATSCLPVSLPQSIEFDWVFLSVAASEASDVSGEDERSVDDEQLLDIVRSEAGNSSE